MTEEKPTDDFSDEDVACKPKKQPVPRDISGVGYVTVSGAIRYCRTGIGIPLPSDFKEWHRPPK